MQTQNLKGRLSVEKSNKFLKITGILMILGGSFSVIAGVLIFIFGVLFVVGDIDLSNLFSDNIGRFAQIGIIIAVLGGIVQFITGIIGVKNAKKPEKANVCLLFGTITALLFIASQVLGTMESSDRGHYDNLSMIFGLIIPAFYLIGAVQLKSKMSIGADES